MDSMTQQAASDYSYPESDNEDIKSQIAKVYERLGAVVKEEVELHHDLEELFAKQQADALLELKRAEDNVKTIKLEQEEMRRQLRAGGLHLNIHSKRRTFHFSSADDETVPSTHALHAPLQFDESPPTTPLVQSKQLGHISLPFHVIHNPSFLPEPRCATPEPPKPKLRYGGNAIALQIAAEKKEWEDQLAGYKTKAESAEERVQQWENIRSTCAAKNQDAGRAHAEQQKAQAQREANNNRNQMADPERQIALRRDLLMQFLEEEEDDEPQIDSSPEDGGGPVAVTSDQKKVKKGKKKGKLEVLSSRF